MRQVECGCGMRGTKTDVYQCALHSECTVRATGKSIPKSDGSGRVTPCIACPDREEPASAISPGSPIPDPYPLTPAGEKLILSCRLSPGDIMTLTAAIESLHATYPGQYVTDVRTPCPAIWEHNPHITPIADDDRSAKRIAMEYPQIHRSNQEPVNFLSCYTEYLGEQIGKPLKLTTNRPHLYLSSAEKGWLTMIEEHHTHGRRVPYWLVNAGVKGDYTAKQWPVEHYQAVIDATFGRIQWVQIGESGHNHPTLANCINLVGQTDHRMLHRLAYHAAGSLGPVTYLMHLMAAFEKPYIYIAGGREPATWLSYSTRPYAERDSAYDKLSFEVGERLTFVTERSATVNVDNVGANPFRDFGLVLEFAERRVNHFAPFRVQHDELVRMKAGSEIVVAGEAAALQELIDN